MAESMLHVSAEERMKATLRSRTGRETPARLFYTHQRGRLINVATKRLKAELIKRDQSSPARPLDC